MPTRDFGPALDGDAPVSIEDILAHLQRWRAGSQSAVESLLACRQEVEAGSRQFESPQAAFEYIDFFVGFVQRAAADIELVVAELPHGVKATHLDTLRQIASNAAVEQRRCLMFRDKWINRPLPYEQVRPLLNRISNETRDQLADYRDLTLAASRLAAVVGPLAPPPAKTMGRRALFNRLFGK
jgi:hypothetical protein